MKYTRQELDLMEREQLAEAYARVVGGGVWTDDGVFRHLAMRNFDVIDTPAELEEWKDEIIAGEKKWCDFKDFSAERKAVGE